MIGDLTAERLQRLQLRVSGWSARLNAAGLIGLVEALMDAAEPLGPLGAQLLWVAQPALGMVMPSDTADDIDGLARLLDDPAGVAWLRSELIGVDAASLTEPVQTEDV
jgi:hypothetical protein